MKKKTEKYIAHSEKIRLQKAKLILARENSIQKVGMGLYLIQSQTGIGSYKIDISTDEWNCNCPDFIKNGHIRPCKHIIALYLYLYPSENNGTIENKPTIKVDYNQYWADYNLAQSMEMDLFDNFLYQLVSLIEEPEQKTGPGRPHHNLRDLLYCCILKTYGQLSSRRSQHLFHDALQLNHVNKNIHYNAISRTLLDKKLTPILYELVHLSAEPVADIETCFAVDSSGFRCSCFGVYHEDKHHVKKERKWLKVHICTGVNTNIVTDVIITKEYGADSPQFKKLIRNTAKRFAIEEVSADMAYLSRRNLEIVGQYGGTAYIPFKKNSRSRSRGSKLWSRAYHYFQLHKDDFLKHYHKRSNVESTFSAIKKKFGETIKSKNNTAQINEMLCKIIAYNITVLIHEMIQLNNTAEFFSLTGLKKETLMNQYDRF